MDKKELGFLLILVIGYIICAYMMNIPTFISIIFIAVLILFLIATLILKVQENTENEKMVKIGDVILVILLVLSVISFITEMQFNKPFMSTGLFMALFLIAMFIKWFFSKN